MVVVVVVVVFVVVFVFVVVVVFQSITLWSTLGHSLPPLTHSPTLLMYSAVLICWLAQLTHAQAFGKLNN